MDDVDSALADQLRALEERLLQPEVRRARAELTALLDEDFVEIGASGRRYDRAAIIAALAADAAPGRVTLADFSARALAPDLVQLVFRTVRDGDPPRAAWRSSLWRRRDGRWRMLFHQGTLTTP